MTPEERAEKIFKYICDEWAGECIEPYYSKYVGEIASQIREAVDEASQCLIDGWNETRAIQKAKAEAFEEAAQIAEEYCLEIGCTASEAEGVVRRTRDAISKTIRARAKEPENSQHGPGSGCTCTACGNW